MSDISQINVGGTIYDVKDAKARDEKQNTITASGLLKGGGNGNVTAAAAGVDYVAAAHLTDAGAHSALFAAKARFTARIRRLQEAQRSLPRTLEATSWRRVRARSRSRSLRPHRRCPARRWSFTTSARVTSPLTGALRYGSAANASASVILSEGDAVTLKCVGTGAGAWTVIGAYQEA